jgi:hypothetical protein
MSEQNQPVSEAALQFPQVYAVRAEYDGPVTPDMGEPVDTRSE